MLKYFYRLQNKKGFTLIELIVVIAIIGILALIAIPRLAGLQENANKKAVLANLKMLDNAIETYASDANVAVNTVVTADLATLVPNWPAGPKTTSYAVAAGVASATVPAGVPGVPAGNYNSDSAGLQ